MPTSPKSKSAPQNQRTVHAGRVHAGRPAPAATAKEQLRALQTSMDTRQ